MAGNNQSRGSVPDYVSSPETDLPQTKRPKTEKNWTKIRDFVNNDDAENFLLSEKCWSKYTTKQTVCGDKAYYRCNRSKLRGKQCESGAYLLYDSKTPTVVLFKSSNDHSCVTDGNASKNIPISDDIKEFIKKSFNDVVRTRKQIQCKLAAAKLLIPTKNQLNNFLKTLREESFGRQRLASTIWKKFSSKIQKYQKMQISRMLSIIISITLVRVISGVSFRHAIC